MLVAVGLLILAADAGAPTTLAADGGAQPRRAADGGARPLDAGVATRPFVAIAESEEPMPKVATAKPAERARVPGVLTTLLIGHTYTFAFFADAYTLPVSRVVDLNVDIVITDSTGRQVIEMANVSRARTMDPKTMFAVPLDPPLRLPLGLTDPEGVWMVRMILFDGVRGTTSRAESSFTVKR